MQRERGEELKNLRVRKSYIVIAEIFNMVDDIFSIFKGFFVVVTESFLLDTQEKPSNIAG